MTMNFKLVSKEFGTPVSLKSTEGYYFECRKIQIKQGRIIFYRIRGLLFFCQDHELVIEKSAQIYIVWYCPTDSPSTVLSVLQLLLPPLPSCDSCPAGVLSIVLHFCHCLFLLLLCSVYTVITCFSNFREFST